MTYQFIINGFHHTVRHIALFIKHVAQFIVFQSTFILAVPPTALDCPHPSFKTK